MPPATSHGRHQMIETRNGSFRNAADCAVAFSMWNKGKSKRPSASPLSSPVEGEEVKLVKRFRLISTIVWVVVLLLLPQLGQAQQREKVRVALGSVSVNSSVIPIGAQHGL